MFFYFCLPRHLCKFSSLLKWKLEWKKNNKIIDMDVLMKGEKVVPIHIRLYNGGVIVKIVNDENKHVIRL